VLSFANGQKPTLLLTIAVLNHFDAFRYFKLENLVIDLRIKHYINETPDSALSIA
jgi:hypothetical protein